MNLLKSKYAWLAAPGLWVAGVILLTVIWACTTPEWVQAYFNNDGTSPVESATIGFFWLQILFFWLMPPMRKSRQRAFWLADFSLLSFFAICRQLDWHKLLISADIAPGGTTGTPFKMRFLTNPNNPLADRLIVLACFIVVLGLFGATLLYFMRRLIVGLFKLHPVCWSMAFFGGSLILIQFADRMPAVLRKKHGVEMSDNLRALSTALEEGQELLLPLFVILAVMQAYFIYNNEPDADTVHLARFREF